MRVGEEKASELSQQLEDAGLTAAIYRRHSLKLKFTSKELAEYPEQIKLAVATAERWSQARAGEV